jgi:hypothetical protein
MANPVRGNRGPSVENTTPRVAKLYLNHAVPPPAKAELILITLHYRKAGAIFGNAPKGLIAVIPMKLSILPNNLRSEEDRSRTSRP